MPFDFYHSLTTEERSRYDLMLETTYVLLKCDEWSFTERDENEKRHRCVSWIQSIQPTLEFYGLDAHSYPQGGLSANRNYYEALRNYLGVGFNAPTLAYLKEGLKDLLALRRDDSGHNLTYLYGSSYKVIKPSSVKEPNKYRSVEVSLRHSAAALWVLCEESNGALSRPLRDSLMLLFDRANRYLAKSEEWQSDGYKHLTLASVINTCKAVIRDFPQSELTERAEQIKVQSQKELLSGSCLVHDVSGKYLWALPDVHKSGMAKYDIYLDTFVLAQVPEILNDPRAQSVVRSMLSELIKTELGGGMPVHRRTNSSDQQQGKPDFGSSAACLAVLWCSLSNGIGDSGWREYCEENFRKLMRFCLNTFDKREYYVLPTQENNTKVLFLPRFLLNDERDRVVDEYVHELKKAIYNEMEHHKGALNKLLGEIAPPPGLEGVKEILTVWQLTKYWQKQNRWAFDLSTPSREMAGSFVVGALRAL